MNLAKQCVCVCVHMCVRRNKRHSRTFLRNHSEYSTIRVQMEKESSLGPLLGKVSYFEERDEIMTYALPQFCPL